MSEGAAAHDLSLEHLGATSPHFLRLAELRAQYVRARAWHERCAALLAQPQPPEVLQGQLAEAEAIQGEATQPLRLSEVIALRTRLQVTRLSSSHMRLCTIAEQRMVWTWTRVHVFMCTARQI